MASKQSIKGSNFERELAAHLNDHLGLKSFRAPLSGGGKIMTAGGADLQGVPNLFIEAKRVERLDFPGALRQAERNKTESQAHHDIPVVINRRNRQATGDAYTLLRLDDFLMFYRAWLIQEGYIGDRDSGRGTPLPDL